MCCYNIIQKEQLLLRQDDGERCRRRGRDGTRPPPAIVVATSCDRSLPGPILSVFPALIVHSALQSVHPGLPVAFIFLERLN